MGAGKIRGQLLKGTTPLLAEWRESDKGPRRRYYRITPKGSGLLAEHEAEWAAFSVGMARAVGSRANG